MKLIAFEPTLDRPNRIGRRSRAPEPVGDLEKAATGKELPGIRAVHLNAEGGGVVAHRFGSCMGGFFVEPTASCEAAMSAQRTSDSSHARPHRP